MTQNTTKGKYLNSNGIAFPGGSAEYRTARNRLLVSEIELRRATEAVAAERRELPPGGIVPEDYVFRGAATEGMAADVRLSDLFAPGLDTLAIYSFMFGIDRDQPCPPCARLSSIPWKGQRNTSASG
jgi:predicted dithiol-disulfide oxidoreductase (DUF899 family)